jgi:hypothetical protein
MDALILRVALLLSLAPSVVCRMQATDVLALAVAETRRQEDAQTVAEMQGLRAAALTNIAVFSPEKLKDEEQKLRARLGGAPVASNAAFEAMLAAAPLVEAP